MKQKTSIPIPADVPTTLHAEFEANYRAITHATDRLLLFTCDHKIEHLNTDFYGPTIHQDSLNPEHMFRIAHQAKLGALATHLGLIARYAPLYPSINYLVKINAKTNSLAHTKHDPLSNALWSIDEVLQFKQTSGLAIRAVGFTIYIGSAHENTMLAQAAHTIYQAHQHGLVATLWAYTYNGSETADIGQRAAGAAGLANALGADFVKIKSLDIKHLPIVTAAAGNTKVICAGGHQAESSTLITQVHQQLHMGNTAGSAIGRNIFQRSLPEAIALCNALAAIIYDNASVEEARKILPL